MNSHSCQNSWTDDLTVCKSTGIGYSINQIYRPDGNPQEDHPYEDINCHFEFSKDFYWYAVFDGHGGKQAAEHCSQHMIAEICFSELNAKEGGGEKTNEEIKDLLRQAFLAVEKGYMETLNDVLAKRTSLQLEYDIPGLTPYEAYKQNPQVYDKIKQCNDQLACGTSAAIALIYKNKLFVANVGNCRVLLCKTDPNSVLKVVQLSVDHDLTNEDEVLRLSQLGISKENLQPGCRLGNQETTRCLGNYSVKGGYKECDTLSEAIYEPVIAEPDIHGGIELDESCRFLLLVTDGLNKSIKEARGKEQINQYIAHCVVEQFREQATLTGVAQAVVDKTVRLHHDWYMSNPIPGSLQKREDITLLLRNFNYPLPNGIKSPSINSSLSFRPISLTESSKTLTNVASTVSSSSSYEDQGEKEDTLGPDQRLEPYVDFSDFYNAFNEAKKNGTLPEGLDWDTIQ